MKQLLSILFLINAFAFFTQEQIQISPDGIFDNVFTQDGTQVHLKDLFVDGRFRDSVGMPEALLIPCSSGYFNLYYEVGSGMEGNSPLEVARRNVLCQVFSDLSQFIVNPNPNTKVNILLGDLDNSLSGYNPSSNPNPAATSGVLGIGTGFYVFPIGAPNYGGIIDNQIWKTINSGIDAYTNVASPLYSTTSSSVSGGLYFHGKISFNFSNPIMNWHLNLSQ